MAIEAKASPTERNSPFFVAHQQMVREWEEFTAQLDGQLVGAFNSWYVDLELMANDLQFTASRKLTTVTVNVIPLDGRYQEKFKLRMRNAEKLRTMSVERKTFLNLHKCLDFGSGVLSLDARYMIKPKIDLDPLTRSLIHLLIQYDLRKFRTSDQKLFVELGTFPSNAAQLWDIMDGLTKWTTSQETSGQNGSSREG